MATFCLDCPRTARLGLHLWALPHQLPHPSPPPAPGGLGRFSDITFSLRPSQSPRAPATREPLTCLTQKGTGRKGWLWGDQTTDACPKETPRDLGLGGGRVSATGKGADGRRAHPTAPPTPTAPMTGGDTPTAPAHPQPPPTPTAPTQEGHHAPPHPQPLPPPRPHWPHLAQEEPERRGQRDQDEGRSHHAPFLTSCVTFGQCVSFSVLSFVSCKWGSHGAPSAILGVTELTPAKQADRHLHTVSA